MAQTNSTPDTKVLRKQAKDRVIKRMLFVGNLITFVLTNLLLFVINYLSNYDNKWYLWSVSGWGAGLLLHGILYGLSFTKISRVATNSLIFHLAVFIIINPYIIFINLFDGSSFSTEITWFWYSFFLWSSILLTHFIVYLFLLTQKPPKAIDIQTLKAQNNRQLLSSNIIAFVIMNISLYYINLWTGYETKWHFWVLTGWGIGILIHLVGSMISAKQFKNEKSRIMLIHSCIFLLIILYLLFINSFDGQTFNAIDRSAWVWYVVFFWGLAYIVHLFLYFIFFKSIDEQVSDELKKIGPKS
jgi:2TM domain